MQWMLLHVLEMNILTQIGKTLKFDTKHNVYDANSLRMTDNPARTYLESFWGGPYIAIMTGNAGFIDALWSHQLVIDVVLPTHFVSIVCLYLVTDRFLFALCHPLQYLALPKGERTRSLCYVRCAADSFYAALLYSDICVVVGRRMLLALLSAGDCSNFRTATWQKCLLWWLDRRCGGCLLRQWLYSLLPVFFEASIDDY